MSEKIYNINMRKAELPNADETVDRRTKYVLFGKGNDYPQRLREMVSQCVELQSIVNGLSDYIAGSGFEDIEDMKIDNKGTMLSELLHALADDYVQLGAFAVQGIRNKLGNLTSLIRVSPENIRIDADETMAFFSVDWKGGKRDVKAYPLYKEDTINENFIFYYANPRTRGVYGLPMWNSAISSVQTAIEIDRFHLESILNNFVPSAIVKMYGTNFDDETKRKLYRDLEDKFSGSSNAARLMVVFGEDKDHTCDIERLSEDNFDTRYQELSKSTREKIFMAFRATPQLFGLDPERSTFNSVEYEQSFTLFNETVVKPMQMEIETAFKKLGYTFKLKSFNIDFGNTTETRKEVGY